MDFLDTQFLFANLIWGSVGIGYCLYGRRQKEIVPMIGGVLMIGVSYFATSAFLMSLLCLGLMVGVYVLVKQGY